MQEIKEIYKGDILTFKATDERYKVILCTSTYIERSPFNYTFAALDYDQKVKPEISDLLDSEFYGTSNKKDDFFKYLDSELETMWSVHPEIRPYYLGSYGFTICRKNFMKFRDSFEKVGNLKIVDNLDKHGNGSVNANDIDFLKDFFANKIIEVLGYRGQKLYKLGAVLRDS